MCGIVGYAGKGNALPVLLDGLQRLEYRGYDSAGVAFQNGHGMEIYKTRGKIRDLRQMIPDPLPHACIGLGHTRWATHGIPCTRNAHPHDAGGIAVVHNGIIENYRELRAALSAAGRVFKSDTDTEVIPHLISYNMEKGMALKESILNAVLQLRGSFAMGIMSEQHPGCIFAARKGSPLVIGLGETDRFFASDIPAILPYARRVIFLDDGELCMLTPGGLEIEYIGNTAPGPAAPISERIADITWTAAMAEKKGYDHFMLKEIHEQPDTVAATFAEWLREPLRLLEECRLTTRAAVRMKRIQIVACGTSYHAALVGKYLIEVLSRIPVEVEIASEYRYKTLFVDRDLFHISITQSGETADTLAAQRAAKEFGAHTMTICNAVGSTASREASSVLYTRAGLEIGVASTKAFTAQMTVLCLLALALGVTRKTISRAEYDTISDALEQIPGFIGRILKSDDALRELAGSLSRAKHFMYLGRGISSPIALEGALKLKEISYIPAQGYPAGEMKHGPIALIEEGLPVIAVAPGDGLIGKVLSNIEEVKARGGRVIAVTDRPDLFSGQADDVVQVPATESFFTPFLTVVPLHLLAYHIAVMRGCDVDQPRNLAKSVTVE
ncbi:MAG: glutamine--fructose-6-phosphate transaminase (isomerizing) [Nitrospiraceae bacterium]|nr:glutamine--fructose-6-phosphate transaminase (isomerizing) [Nitrospiraceae bacterium]